jgi:hypothetical protein
MRDKLVIICVLIFGAGLLLGALLLPVWHFRPCSLTVYSTVVDLPEVDDPIFADALAQILKQSDESHMRVGKHVYVTLGLARDAEIRSKYTGEALYNAVRSNSTYKPVLDDTKLGAGLLIGDLFTNQGSTNRAPR